MRICLLVTVFFLAGCAIPEIDRSGPAFDHARYEKDMQDCQGGHAAAVAAHGLGSAVVGSLYGVVYGAYYGAIGGDTTEGVIAGSIAGSVIGLVKGAAEPIKAQERTIGKCMAEKGYVLVSS